MIAGVVTVTVAIVLLASFLYARPQVFQSGVFFAHRAINAFSHYVFNAKPDFYFLRIEKTGRTFRWARMKHWKSAIVMNLSSNL